MLHWSCCVDIAQLRHVHVCVCVLVCEHLGIPWLDSFVVVCNTG